MLVGMVNDDPSIDCIPVTISDEQSYVIKDLIFKRMRIFLTKTQIIVMNILLFSITNNVRWGNIDCSH